MPFFRNVEVRITDQTGCPLQEYGIQKLSNANQASCYIESKTDERFRIYLKPVMPFPDFPKPR